MKKVCGAIEKHYQVRIQKLHIHYNERIKNIKETYGAEIENWQKKMIGEQEFTYHDQTFKGPRYADFEQKWITAALNRDAKVASLENDMLAETSRLEEEASLGMIEARAKLKMDPSSANKVVSATLQVINMDSDYPKSQYLLCIAVLTLLLSIGLEYVLWGGFSVLAMMYGDVFINAFQVMNEKVKYQQATGAISELQDIERKACHQNLRKEKRAALRSIKGIFL